MNIKNLRYTVTGAIDCDYEHPTYGWIPFTASPFDSDSLGREVYASALVGDFGPVADADTVQFAAQARAAAKVARAQAVEAITVTTASGNTFDGDELSQGRMSRAIIALSTGLAPSVTWVLADNSTIEATAAELTEALVLAGMAQAAIWVIP